MIANQSLNFALPFRTEGAPRTLRPMPMEHRERRPSALPTGMDAARSERTPGVQRAAHWPIVAPARCMEIPCLLDAGVTHSFHTGAGRLCLPDVLYVYFKHTTCIS
jgi:hypothetical protein